MITETDDLAEAIDIAARRWPHARNERADLLRLIIKTGIDSLEAEVNHVDELKRKAISNLAGSYSDTWPDGWREELANEWPE